MAEGGVQQTRTEAAVMNSERKPPAHGFGDHVVETYAALPPGFTARSPLRSPSARTPTDPGAALSTSSVTFSYGSVYDRRFHGI